MTSQSYQVHACRGLEGGCPCALWVDGSVIRALEEVLLVSSWFGRAAQAQRDRIPPHEQFKIALAACPNACTMPQIRAIGIIAVHKPTNIGPACNGCGGCTRACREGAVVQSAGRAELRPGRCVGCGACIRVCPQQAINAGKVRLRVLIGGRMGRHPRWAEELCIIGPESLPDILHALLDDLAGEARPGEGLTRVIERVGVARLAQRIEHIAGSHNAADDQ